MNKVFLIGNLTRDPELRETPSGISACRFSIAVQRPYSSQDGERQTDFFECTAWRGLGESIARYTKKGKKVAVTGSIQIRSYEDNQGIKRTAVDIIVSDCEFLSPKSVDDLVDDAEEQTQPQRRTNTRKPTLQVMEDGEDIPF